MDNAEASRQDVESEPVEITEHADEAYDPAAEAALVEEAIEVEVAEVDPVMQAELLDLVSEVEALVEPTFEGKAPERASETGTSLVGPEPPAAPEVLADAGVPEAVAIAVEAELQAEALAAENEAEPAAGEAVTAQNAAQEPSLEAERPVMSEAAPEDGQPEKPRKRARKAREQKPVASVAEAVEGLSQARTDLPVSIGPLVLNGSLSLEAMVESLLFVADGAVPVARLAEALEIHSREVEAALAALADSFQDRGLSLQRFRDRVQLTTAPAAAPLVERFLGLAASSPLSRAALEALAIIAYQQPVTRPQIEAVRGVNSDSVIKNLLTKGLIEESGRAEGPGRPLLYSTTTEFMQHFGLASLSDLPPLTPPSMEPDGENKSADELLKG